MFLKVLDNKISWCRFWTSKLSQQNGAVAPVKAHANGPNIAGQHNPTLLGPTMLWLNCCVRLHGTTTMLALVAYSLKPVKPLGPCKRTQHCWPATPNNVGICWHLLRPLFAWASKEQLNDRSSGFWVRNECAWIFLTTLLVDLKQHPKSLWNKICIVTNNYCLEEYAKLRYTFCDRCNLESNE